MGPTTVTGSSSCEWHQRLSSHFCHALGRAAPRRLEVLEAINVRVAPGRILISDSVVVTNPGFDLAVWR